MGLNAELFILYQGIPLCHLNLGSSTVLSQEMQFDNYLTAIMALPQFSSNGISELELEEIRATIYNNIELSVNIILLSKKEKSKTLINTVKQINEKFCEYFNADDLMTSMGNIKIFEPFLNEVEKDFKEIQKKRKEKKIDIQKLNLFEDEILVIKELEKLNKKKVLASRITIEDGHIIKLDLSNLGLKFLPESIGLLKKLQYLDLLENSLKTLPNSFRQLGNLKKLNINHNQFNKLPYSIGLLKNLENMPCNFNPWDTESKIIVRNSLPFILEHCRKRATITIFISHAWDDQEKYKIIELKKNLQKRNEIYEVIICEKDLVGDIINFMDEKVSKSHLLIFLATQNSISSKNCQYELALALTHDIEIIPIKGTEINWEDLNNIDLTEENQDYFDLGHKKGFEFNMDNLEEFCDELYEYIVQYKREINLFESEEGKIDKQIFNIKNTINKFIESEEFKDNIKENLDQFEKLFQKFNNGLISQEDYFYECAQIIQK